MPKGVYVRTKPVWNKGRTNIYSVEVRAKMGAKNKGRVFSQERLEKMRESMLGQKRALGTHHKEPWSLEYREKLSKRMKGTKYGALNRGVKRSAEAKKKMSERMKASGIVPPSRLGFRKVNGITTYERKLYLNSRRRAIKKGCLIHHTQKEWETMKERYNYICPRCFKGEPEIKLTRDHITPLTRRGEDGIENIQPLCKSCNSIKHTKEYFYG